MKIFKWHWSVWVKGLVAAAISGASSGVTAAIVVPDINAIHPGALNKIILVGALVGAATYLKQSPLPQTDSEPSS